MLGVSCLNLVHLETVAQTSLMYMLLTANNGNNLVLCSLD